MITGARMGAEILSTHDLLDRFWRFAIGADAMAREQGAKVRPLDDGADLRSHVPLSHITPY
jgi:hypothetical protein